MTQMMMPDAGAEPDHTHTTPNGQPAAGSPESGNPRRKRRRRRGGKGRSGAPGATAADNREHHDAEAPPSRSAPTRQRGIGADTTNPEVFDQDTAFDTLGLSEPVLRGLHEAGFQRPTYIQARLLPAMLSGRDVLGQAKTGTGKTAAFGLPLLHMVRKGAAFSALILAPTRELAMQITEEINQLGRHTGLTAVTVYGGQRIQTQVDKLNRGPEIIVGTPGRIFDMVDRGHLHFKNVRFAVLDEVDRMLDIGFREDIRRILSRCPAERQTVVVSATISRDIEDLARRYMRNPEKIVTTAGSLTASMVEQHYLAVAPWDKKKLLLHLLKHEEPALNLVFCRLKRTVDELARYLNAKGVETHAIHGDMSQSRRTATMRKFKEGELAVLIASDLASRGIDVDGISHVVNYDLPEDPDLYVHRIGRTARAGRKGVAWAFVTPEQGKLLTQIERLVNAEIPRMDYPDFAPTQKPDTWRPEPTGRRPPVEIVGVPDKARNRLAAPQGPQLPDDPAKLAAKFPGGVVPSKLPPKTLRGRVPTRRGG